MAPEVVLLLDHLADSPTTVNDIHSWTRRDPVLAQVLQFIERGWPQNLDSSYLSRKTKLAVLDGCILWGSIVIIPAQGQKAVLHELHSAHPGMTKMKSLARMYVWWPGLDKDIEETAHLHNECQLNQSNPPVAPLNPWSWPSRPWARVHLDYAGPIEGHYLLIMIDAHSKWIEALPTQPTPSHATIELLRSIFAQFGLPETIVSDNGSCFVSEKFQQFLKAHGIKQITSAPYHPSSNGLAERAVQIVKKGLKKTTEGSIKCRIAKVLFAYRNIPHCTTGNSPAKLLLGRQFRTRLDLLRPNTSEHVEKKQWDQKLSHDGSVKSRTFSKGQSVLIRVYGQNRKWTYGTILKPTGPVSYIVQLPNGTTWRRHHDQLKTVSEQMTPLDQSVTHVITPKALLSTPSLCKQSPLQTVSARVSRRYPTRIRNPPSKYFTYPFA